MRLLTSNANVRSTYAVPVSGAFNDYLPGRAYIGFCGLMKRGGGVSEPFFASNMPTVTSNGEAVYVLFDDQAAARCKGAKSKESYASIFRHTVTQRSVMSAAITTPRRSPLSNLVSDSSAMFAAFTP